MDYHMLNVHVAKECGVHASLILVNLKFWIEKNQANKKHFYDGRYWTYCSAEAMCDTFEYLSPKQIRTAVNKLVEGGYILKGNYNKSAYDRTLWYALTDKGYALFCNADSGISTFPNGKIKNAKRENQNDSKGGPIPDNIPDNITDNIPPLTPPEGGTGPAPDAPANPAEPSPNPEPSKPKRGTRRKDPSRSPELTPDEEATLMGYSPTLCDAVRRWFSYKAERREMYGETFRRTFLEKVAENASKYGADAVTQLITDSLSCGYQGVTWDKLSKRGGGPAGTERKRTATEMVAEMQRMGGDFYGFDGSGECR